jgi:putative membrane protein
MILPALLAYGHYFSILLVISSLVTELFVFGRILSAREMKILQRADAFYGIGAILVLITGFLRIYNFGKGPDYYFSNAVFLAKLGIFIIVGLLSIYPTIVFLKWRKLKTAGEGIELDINQYKKIRHFILLETILVFMLPLLAALMARGIG